jgi:hypothetical protein
MIPNFATRRSSLKSISVVILNRNIRRRKRQISEHGLSYQALFCGLPDCWGIFHRAGTHRNEIRLATGYTDNRATGLIAATCRNYSFVFFSIAGATPIPVARCPDAVRAEKQALV